MVPYGVDSVGTGTASIGTRTNSARWKISWKLASNPFSTSNGGFQEVIPEVLPSRPISAMPLILTTGFATRLSEWLTTGLVETATEAGPRDIPGSAPVPGPVDGSSTPAVASGSAAGAVLSVGPRGVLTFAAAPVWGRSEPPATAVAGFSSMLLILPRCIRATADFTAGSAHSLIERYESSIFQKMCR